MLLQCLTERDGDTTVHVGHFRYDFKKRPDGRSLCEVVSVSHVNWLLKSGSFMVAQEERGRVKPTDPPVPRPPGEDAAGQPQVTEEDVDLDSFGNAEPEYPVDEPVVPSLVREQMDSLWDTVKVYNWKAFKGWVEANREMIKLCDADVQDRFRERWKRGFPDEPFPLEDKS